MGGHPSQVRAHLLPENDPYQAHICEKNIPLDRVRIGLYAAHFPTLPPLPIFLLKPVDANFVFSGFRSFSGFRIHLANLGV